MAYTVGEIKVAAYNRTEKPDFDYNERNLFICLAYCYDCFRAGYDKDVCERLMKNYIEFFENAKIRG